jgi:hypothetical protein
VKIVITSITDIFFNYHNTLLFNNKLTIPPRLCLLARPLLMHPLVELVGVVEKCGKVWGDA